MLQAGEVSGASAVRESGEALSLHEKLKVACAEPFIGNSMPSRISHLITLTDEFYHDRLKQ